MTVSTSSPTLQLLPVTVYTSSLSLPIPPPRHYLYILPVTANTFSPSLFKPPPRHCLYLCVPSLHYHSPVCPFTICHLSLHSPPFRRHSILSPSFPSPTLLYLPAVTHSLTFLFMEQSWGETEAARWLLVMPLPAVISSGLVSSSSSSSF